MRGMVPELTTCSTDNGYGFTDSAPTSGTTFICQSASTGNAVQANHTVVWPALPTGWAYNTPVSTPVATSLNSTTEYTFSASKSGQADITCLMSTGVCS